MKIKVRETNETSPRIATARHIAQCRMDVGVRGFPTMIADEPPHHGGEDAGPTPLEYVTAGLAACQTVTVAKIAEAMRLPLEHLEVVAETQVGWTDSTLSTAKIPRFTSCSLTVQLSTKAPAERIATLKRLVEERCPASNLFLDAGLAPTVTWSITAPGG